MDLFHTKSIAKRCAHLHNVEVSATNKIIDPVFFVVNEATMSRDRCGMINEYSINTKTPPLQYFCHVIQHKSKLSVNFGIASFAGLLCQQKCYDTLKIDKYFIDPSIVI